MTCPCPFTLGDLMAIGAIAEVHGPPQTRKRLATLCYEHAKQHATPTSEEDEP